MAITCQDGYISAASSLLKWGVQIVVITRARSGASAMIKSELTTSLIEYQQPINPVAICDTTGAGDAFASLKSATRGKKPPRPEAPVNEGVGGTSIR